MRTVPFRSASARIVALRSAAAGPGTIARRPTAAVSAVAAAAITLALPGCGSDSRTTSSPPRTTWTVQRFAPHTLNPVSAGAASVLAGRQTTLITAPTPGDDPTQQRPAFKLSVRDGHARQHDGGLAAFTPPQPLPSGGSVAVVPGTGSVDLALEQVGADGERTGMWPLLSRGTVLAADVAVTPAGHVVVAWTEHGGGEGSKTRAPSERTRTQVAYFPSLQPPPTGGAPTQLRRTLRTQVDRSVEDDAIAVAATDDRAVVAQAAWPRGWSRAVIFTTVGDPSALPRIGKRPLSTAWNVTGLDALITGDRTIVAWGEQHHGEQADSPWQIHAAIRPANGPFAPPRPLDASPTVSFPPTYRVQLAAEPGGGARLAWSMPDRGGAVIATGPGKVRSAALIGDRFDRVRTVMPGALGGIATRADGAAVISGLATAYAKGSTTPGITLRAATAPDGPAAPFGEALVVGRSSDQPLEGVDASPPAFDPRGRPLLAWTEPGIFKLATGPTP